MHKFRISIEGANLHLTFISFCSNQPFLIWIFWKQKTGFGKVMKKERNARFPGKERNVGSGPPPLLDPVTSVVQASSYLSVCQPNSQGLNPYRKTGLILGSWRWFQNFAWRWCGERSTKLGGLIISKIEAAVSFKLKSILTWIYLRMKKQKALE